MVLQARMKMDRHTTEACRKKRVKELVREMGIGKSYNTLISALSGGEQKRLSLAVQVNFFFINTNNIFVNQIITIGK